MVRRPPGATRTDTLFPYAPPVRSGPGEGSRIRGVVAGRSVVVERVAGVGIAVHPGEIGRGCAQLLDALRRDTRIEVAVVTEPRDLQLRCKFGACGNPIPSGFCNAATVVRDSGIDEGYGGPPPGCGAADRTSPRL